MCRALHRSAAGGVKRCSCAGGDAADETILALVKCECHGDFGIFSGPKSSNEGFLKWGLPPNHPLIDGFSILG